MLNSNSTKKRYNLLEFKTYGDSRGFLTPIENGIDVPFEIKRLFYIYGTRGKDIVRGNHANRNSKLVLMMPSGSCKIKIFNNDGSVEEIIELNSPYKGLYIENMTYKEMYDFSENAVMLVLASEHFGETEYIDSIEELQEALKNG